MQLGLYLETQGITQTEFGNLIGVSQSTVSEWVRGKEKPTMERLPDIELMTKGAVTRHDFYPDFPWTA